MSKKNELKLNNAVKGTLESGTGPLLSSGCFYTSTPNQQPDHHDTDPNSNIKESISKWSQKHLILYPIQKPLQKQNQL